MRTLLRWVFAVGVVIVVIIVVALWKGRRRPESGLNYVERSDEEIRRDIMAGKITSRYADIEGVIIDPDKVPDDLRELIPLARKWAISDDVERGIFEEIISSEEKKDFIDKVWPRMARLEEYCAKFRNNVPVPDEVVLFDMMTESAAEVYHDVYPMNSKEERE